MAEPKQEFVNLNPKDNDKNKGQKFPINQANALLNLPNTKWELDDKEWNWNGKELAKAKSNTGNT